ATSVVAQPTAQAESAHRKFLASTPPTSRDMGTDRHRKLAHPLMADPRRSQPQLSRLPKCVDSTLHASRPLEVDRHIPVRRNVVALTQMGHCARNPGSER